MVISRDARSGGPRVPLPVPAPRGTKELVPIAAMPCTEADWDRFWSKVDATGDCWLWTRSITNRGYGQFSFGGRPPKGGPQLAHVMAYRLLIGEVPLGKELDHRCRVKRCVNPGHLEPVTRKVNTQRGGKVHASKVQRCAESGHRIVRQKHGGGRLCRDCANEKQRVTR